MKGAGGAREGEEGRPLLAPCKACEDKHRRLQLLRTGRTDKGRRNMRICVRWLRVRRTLRAGTDGGREAGNRVAGVVVWVW